MRQDSQKWPWDPIGYVVKDNSPAPQQPDGDSCGCCVLMGLEALCAGNALDGAGRFRRMPSYTRLDIAQSRARWQRSLLRETHGAAATNKSLAAAARAERQIRIDLSED
ncbi:hypothetical protein M885DRAFT_622103 [Pelagophyceae sp. CCMP2097]|nr:hypothetical protein M885DRAFT_622103 [Pelagophyceae sp. CCMP2097]